MGSLCDVIKLKLNEYGYEIYNINKTSNYKEFCIMTKYIVIFVDEKDNSVSLSFECNCEPVYVAESMIILNQIDEINKLYISESYFFDNKHKKFIVGEEAKKASEDIKHHMLLKGIMNEQIYSHILATQKCHEC